MSVLARVTTSDFKICPSFENVLNKTLLFDSVGNVLRSRNSFIYPNATRAFFVGCDRRFVYDALYPRYFPKIRRVYLLPPYGSPFSDDSALYPVLYRFGTDSRNVQVHLSDRTGTTFVPESEVVNMPWVKFRSHDTLLKIIGDHREEPLGFYYNEYVDSKHSRYHS